MVNTDIYHDLAKATPCTAWLFLQNQILACVIFPASHKLQSLPWGSEKMTSEH